MAAGRRHAKHSPVDYILLFVTPISINFAKSLLMISMISHHFFPKLIHELSASQAENDMTNFLDTKGSKS